MAECKDFIVFESRGAIALALSGRGAISAQYRRTWRTRGPTDSFCATSSAERLICLVNDIFADAAPGSGQQAIALCRAAARLSFARYNNARYGMPDIDSRATLKKLKDNPPRTIRQGQSADSAATCHFGDSKRAAPRSGWHRLGWH